MRTAVRCPSCKNEKFRRWDGVVKVCGVEVQTRGDECTKCGEILFAASEVEANERTAATAIVERGIRTPKEFRFVRKAAGLQANELASMLDVRPETVSRWERGEVDIPRPISFALGELFERPRVTRQKLEALAR